jgi:hypothetical protein
MHARLRAYSGHRAAVHDIERAGGRVLLLC